VYVTRDRVPFSGSIPNTPRGPAHIPDQRQYCAVWGDRLSIGGVADEWVAPER
jgi:hypothetical protein